MGCSSDDGGDELGKTRHVVLLVSAGITFVYVIGSFFIYGCLCTFRLRHHQMKHVVHMRERISAMSFLFMLALTQVTGLNLSWYISQDFVARRISETALLFWIILSGLALMTLFVSAFSRTYARIHMYLGIIFTTCATLGLVADAVVSGKVAVLDPILGATCLVGLWTVFYAVPMAFHLTIMMTGPSDLKDASYEVAVGLGHTPKSNLLIQTLNNNNENVVPVTDNIIMSDVESINYIMQENDQKQEIVYDTGDSEDNATELENVQLSEPSEIERT